MGKMRYDEVQHWRFPQGCLDLLTGGRRSRQRKNSGPYDSPYTNAGQVERAQRTLQLTFGRSRFSQQMIRAFGLEKLKRHSAKSCHHRAWLVNLKIRTQRTDLLSNAMPTFGGEVAPALARWRSHYFESDRGRRGKIFVIWRGMADELGKFVLGDAAISAVEQAQPLRRGFFGRRKKEPKRITHCENCGAQLEGHWCAKCGQPAIDYRRSFRHVIADLLNEFLNWDSKFFSTILLLLTRPWKLTNEFLAGHRVRHVHPLRLYLLASILFFFAATYGIKSVHLQPIDLSPGTLAEIRSELQQENVSPEIRDKIEQALGGKPISPEKRAALEKQLKDENLPKPARDAIQQRLEYGDPAPWDTRTKLEDILKDLPPDGRKKVEESLKKAQDKVVIFEADKDEKPNDMPKWLEKRAREKFGEHGTNIQLFLVTLMSNLPYMMLVCIPLFACVLKILYIRRRVFYIDHLVYALHIHTFAYVGVILIVLATIGLNRAAPGPIAGWIIALLWITFTVLIFLSVRRVYRQGWFISIFKFFFGGIVYLLVFVAAVAATFFVTLVMP
jgi:hypothetical protein